MRFASSANALPQLIEAPNDLNSEVLQLRKNLDHRPRFSPSVLTERYLHYELSVLLDLTFEINGFTSGYSALIAKSSVEYFDGQLNRWSADDKYNAGWLSRNSNKPIERRRPNLYSDDPSWWYCVLRTTTMMSGVLYG